MNAHRRHAALVVALALVASLTVLVAVTPPADAQAQQGTYRWERTNEDFAVRPDGSRLGPGTGLQYRTFRLFDLPQIFPDGHTVSEDQCLSSGLRNGTCYWFQAWAGDESPINYGGAVNRPGSVFECDGMFSHLSVATYYPHCLRYGPPRTGFPGSTWLTARYDEWQWRMEHTGFGPVWYLETAHFHTIKAVYIPQDTGDRGDGFDETTTTRPPTSTTLPPPIDPSLAQNPSLPGYAWGPLAGAIRVTVRTEDVFAVGGMNRPTAMSTTRSGLLCGGGSCGGSLAPSLRTLRYNLDVAGTNGYRECSSASRHSCEWYLRERPRVVSSIQFNQSAQALFYTATQPNQRVRISVSSPSASQTQYGWYYPPTECSVVPVTKVDPITKIETVTEVETCYTPPRQATSRTMPLFVQVIGAPVQRQVIGANTSD